jgi:predicted nucleotide-binding protein (sugar kinase/HSP70/actin superfamily)
VSEEQRTPMNSGRGHFSSLRANVGQFHLASKTVLIPEMSRAGCLLLAAAMRSFGVSAQVMETYGGLQLGKQYTSGKECFPCQVTLGDLLVHLEKERKRLGDAFRPENYVYFMAESGGPCRFGMYNKLHRIILDSMDGFSRTRIASISSKDSYALGGLMAPEARGDFRRTAYLGVVLADVLDRILWRTRPYEKEKGLAEAHFEESLKVMTEVLETYGRRKRFRLILERLERLAKQAKEMIDPAIPPKPLIGMIGEIYLRTHRPSNQEIIRLLEEHGAEVVNASLAEWINYVSYESSRKERRDMVLALRRRDRVAFGRHLKAWLRHRTELAYQYLRQDQVYRRVGKHLAIHPDHRVDGIERRLDRDRLFSFAVGTEACLSIGGALEYAFAGFDGIVNVFPFTCMPSTMSSAILKPLLDRLQIPYLDSAYDGTFQPNREAGVRTFMYQASQHQRERLGQGGSRH